MSEGDGPFGDAVAAVDECLARTGPTIWVGMEPTFTDRGSEDPTWRSEAIGGDKEARAQTLVADLARRTAGGVVMRTVGRQYAGEDRPRWSYGVYCRRDGTPLWTGPPDPLTQHTEGPGAFGDPVREPTRAADFARSLLVALERDDVLASELTIEDSNAPHRIVWRDDGKPLEEEQRFDPELRRDALGSVAIANDGPRDLLSECGLRMVAIGVDPVAGCCRVELPRLRSVDEQCAILAALAEAAATAELRSLVLAGFPPQVDERIAWTTVTPDPAVIEVNIAPSRNGRELLASLRTVYASAERLGLSSFQWRYNGDLADSGGGGHVTLGGPSPSASPFVAHPTLLARLVVYLNRHPALSYLFAGLGVGGSSQAPRCDEGSGEGIDELKLALAIIAARPDDVATVEVAWQMLAPFLTDRAGNPHRAEINVEKLWNPYLPGRGRSGLVELRALQMPATPERAVAIALLFATIVARLALAAPRPFELASWGDELHDRWSLPFHQRRDLADVVRDLAEHGFDLPAAIRDELFDDEHRMIGRAEIDGMRIEARRASEFWPLTHEASTENTGTSRLVDASTARTEVVLRPTSDATLAPLRALMHGRATELHKESDDSGPALVLGVRHRTFVPRPGLHPTLAPIDPLLIDLVRSDGGTWRVCIDAWQPGGGPYDGLPRTAAEAVRRRDERFRVERVAANQVRAAEDDTGSYVVDLRWPRQGP